MKGDQVISGYSRHDTNLLKSHLNFLVKKIPLLFNFEPEITAKLASVKGIRFYEVGISYFGRKYDEGKKIGWKDGVRALYVISRYSFYRSNINITE